MILEALTQYYEALLSRGVIARPGWGQAKVSYGLELAGDGALLSLLPLETEQQRGKQTVMAPRIMEVPMPVKRTVGISANFLCDNSGYLLGADSKGKPQRTAKCFEACRALHLQLLADVASPAAQAVAAFFESWDPAAAATHPVLSPKWDKLMEGGNLLFWYRDAPVCDDPAVRARWQRHYDGRADGPQIRCLVTGQKAPPETIHPAIKGVQGAQSSGAALVSFNAPAFWSYGHEYGENAPVGAYAAFAYTTALNHLLADREHVQHIGDTTVVCWAAGGQSVYQDLGMAALYGDTLTEGDLPAVLHKLANGEPVVWDGTALDPDTRFYVLGLSPNAARISVRFFWRNSFGELARNVQAHYDRLQIVRPLFDKSELLSLWQLLWETVNKNARDPKPSPQLEGDVLRAILTNGPYPATLLTGVTLRIRAERTVTRGRAAILKAYYQRNPNPKCPEEVLTVEKNGKSDYLPYALGELFAVLEALQEANNPDLNATIRDKFFNSASATPALVFPHLLKLAQKHWRKLELPQRIYYDKQIAALLEKIGSHYPARMSLPEQGAFQLGYYHQKQERFKKKEEKEDV